MVPSCFPVELYMWSFGLAVLQFQKFILGGFEAMSFPTGNAWQPIWDRAELYVACCRPGTQAVTFLAWELLGAKV